MKRSELPWFILLYVNKAIEWIAFRNSLTSIYDFCFLVVYCKNEKKEEVKDALALIGKLLINTVNKVVWDG